MTAKMLHLASFNHRHFLRETVCNFSLEFNRIYPKRRTAKIMKKLGSWCGGYFEKFNF